MEKYEFKIICTQVHGPLVDEFNFLGIELIVIGIIKHPFHWKRIRSVLKVIHSYKPHIIHGAVFEGVSMALICGFLGRVPIRIGEETSDPQNRSTKASLFLGILSLLSHRMIAISPSVFHYLNKKAFVPKRKIRLILNGIDSPRKVNPVEILSLRKQLGIQVEDIVIGSVGRLNNAHKRFTDLIEAISVIPNRESIKILIVGDGMDRQLIEDVAKKFDLLDNLVMAGYAMDTSPYYKLMDVFCISSSREGFGLVAAEAMMHTLPVIATNVGGLASIVKDGITGFLVPAFDPIMLGSKITQLIYNPLLRCQMGEAGFERATQHYSSRRYVQEIDALYQELLFRNATNKQKKLVEINNAKR